MQFICQQYFWIKPLWHFHFKITLKVDGQNSQELGFVREKMQDALSRLRELEEQVKTIPKLQVQISILEQQKIQLLDSVTKEKEKAREFEREKESIQVNNGPKV